MKLTHGTVLFLDLRNFTVLCTQMEANQREKEILENGLTQYEARLDYLIEQTRQFYHEWHDCIASKITGEIIDHYLFQVLGDGVMIALEGKGHAQAALDVATEISQTMLRKLNDVINPRIRQLGIQRSEDLLDFGIGIYTGDYCYVQLPGTNRSDSTEFSHTIIGTAANYASRVESANKHHDGVKITIAQTTVDEICMARGIDPTDFRRVEDVLDLVYAWKHRFRGMPPVGLYFRHID